MVRQKSVNVGSQSILPTLNMKLTEGIMLTLIVQVTQIM